MRMFGQVSPSNIISNKKQNLQITRNKGFSIWNVLVQTIKSPNQRLFNLFEGDKLPLKITWGEVRGLLTGPRHTTRIAAIRRCFALLSTARSFSTAAAYFFGHVRRKVHRKIVALLVRRWTPLDLDLIVLRRMSTGWLQSDEEAPQTPPDERFQLSPAVPESFDADTVYWEAIDWRKWVTGNWLVGMDT